MNDYDSEPVPVVLPNGTRLYVNAAQFGGEEEVSAKFLSFTEVTKVVEGIAEATIATLKKIKPQKATVEFGLEVAVESGQLTTLLVKGSGTSHLTITLEWGEGTP